MNTERFRVGVIRTSHGLNGEAKVFVTSESRERFKTLKNVYAAGPRGSVPLVVEQVRFAGDAVLCKFEGIDTPEEIRKYRGMDIMIDRKDAIPCGENEFYIPDLIGLEVRTDTGETIGTVSDLFPTGANRVLTVKTPEGHEILIPYIDEFVTAVRPEEGYVTVHLMDGLI